MSDNKLTQVQAACGHMVDVTTDGVAPEQDYVNAVSSICPACETEAAEAAQAVFDAELEGVVVTTQEIVVNANTLSRVVKGVGIIAPELGASVVNGVYGAVDHMSTSPNILAANARISGTISNAKTNITVSIEEAKLRNKDPQVIAARDQRKAAIGGFFKKVGSKAAEVGSKVAATAPVKVVIDQGKAVAGDVKAFVDSTDIPPITITTVVTQKVCRTCGQAGTEDNPVLGNGICEGCNEAHDIDHDPDNFSIHD